MRSQSHMAHSGTSRVLVLEVVLFLMSLARIDGQELPVYQMYLHQPSLINPAIIGSEECTELMLIDRHQWIGAFKGAPRTQVLTAESSISSKKSRSHGLGLQIVNDANGAYKQLAGSLGYAYHISLNREGSLRLGFGLMATVYQSTVDERDFSRINDPIVHHGVEKDIRPDVSSGVFLHGDRFFLGFSGIQLLASNSRMNPHRGERGYFAYGGYNHPVSRQLILQPGMTVKYLSKQFQSDLNTRVIYRESYWVMLSYRHIWDGIPGQPNSLLIYAGLYYKNFSFAYGYDLGLTSMQKYGFGSHEFRIGCHFCPFENPCPAYK
jgi:type IX secretion system PorP/SprF family membrane protein